mgnify:CR=1 FL=1
MEPSLVSHPLQISLGRTHDPDVHLDVFAPADTLESPILKHAPHPCLHIWRDRIDIIIKQGSLGRQFEPSTSLSQRPGKRALFIPE